MKKAPKRFSSKSQVNTVLDVVDKNRGKVKKLYVSFIGALSGLRQFLFMQQNNLIRNIRLISNFMTSHPG